ncbi:MAG: TRAP transporter large permease subunit [Treponema sp.]|jgi:tripartite ATP-independent transporter DctM subunit|nr:TRAP transporter large permease subunit [Treponema sp.]
MIRKICDAIAVAFVFLLSLATLAFKVMQDMFKITILDSDTIVVNILFVFACIAGVVTWREGRHISLASLTDKAPPRAAKVIARINAFAIPFVLTLLFLASFSEMFVAFEPGSTVLGIPLIAVFAVLPLAYLAMLGMRFARDAHRISAALGIAAGLCAAASPIAGIVYSLTGFELPFLTGIFDAWCAFAGAATIPLVVLCIVLAFLGVPLFVVVSAVSYIAFSQGGGYVEVIPIEAYGILTDKTIAAIPLFTIAGYLFSKGSAGSRLVEVFRGCFGWFRGGAVVAAIIVTTFFTTFTGVSGVTILALGSLLTIMLSGSGYSTDNARSLITSSGAIGLLFPPSMAIILYGSANYFSVDIVDLFKGALIPGCLLALGMIAIGFMYDKNPARKPFSAAEALRAFKNSALELLMPVLICLGYFTGFFSLTESAAFAVVYAICLETFVRRDFTIPRLLSVIVESLPISGGLLFILASARGLSYFLMDANIPQLLSQVVLSYVSSKYVFLILLNLVLIAVGCLMDINSAILIVSPLIIPIAESFGLSPVHTGVIFLMNMQLGFLTPPVGMDLFIASYTFDIPVLKVVRGILPFLLVQFIVLLLVTYIPWFSSVLL